ncbi:MAG: acetyl-CoA acetyltransferase [Pyrinomonadaceae bacterium]
MSAARREQPEQPVHAITNRHYAGREELMMLLEGKAAVVTGSGRGIGRSVAGLFARHGAGVVVNDLDEEVARQALEEIRADGGRAVACHGSVTDDDFAGRLVGAALGIAAGLCEVVLITYGSSLWSDRSALVGQGGVDPRMPAAQFEMPYGDLSPIAAYALAAARHMHEYGTTAEQLAEVAVSTRQWATLNPRALLREPLTVADVVQSPMVASPLHKLDCCLMTDGGGAVVVTSAERARDLRRPPVYLLGSGFGSSHLTISQMDDLTTTAAVTSGRRAFQTAGVTPADIDLVEVYDSFTISVVLALEDLGFCEKGEGGRFVQGGRLAPGGELPTDTSGGGLSYTHPGALGIFLIIEAVRQLRGECSERQVPDAELALVHGIGGWLSAHATLILGR